MESKKALEKLGKSFPNYCDPDTSYEEDARAWHRAFEEVLEEIEQ